MLSEDVEKNLNYYFIGNPRIDESLPISTIEEAYNYLKDQEVVSIDIETTRKYDGKYDKISKEKYGKNKAVIREGLDPFLTNIVMFQIGTKEKQFIIDYRVTSLGDIRKILTNDKIIKVGQNIKFEYKHILHNEGIRISNLYDTMICEKILFNGLAPKSSLKALNEKYLNITVDKGTRLEFLTIGDKPFSFKQIEYGAEDILYPLLIRDQQMELVRQRGVLSCLKLEMLFLPVLGDIEYKGMYFNQEKWLKVYEKNLIKSNEVREKLDQFVISNYKDTNFVKQQLELFSDDLSCNISWTSSKQVIGFFKYLNICPQEVSKTTKKLAYTVNAKVIKSSLKTINKDTSKPLKELLSTYLEFKEIEQSCTTFGKDFLKYVNPITNRIHSNYNQILNTGRISSNNPNLQNIPADDDFRSCFDSPDGYNIVNADYSGQEQIILANKSEDKDLIAFYEQNLGDMHSFISSKIFPDIIGDTPLADIKKLFPEQRQIAKAAGFAINYGGNGYTISKNLGVDVSVGDEVYDAYFDAFPGLKNYFNKVTRETDRQGYILIDPQSGRKTWFIKPKNNKERSAVHRKAQNFPIQGEAGGITKYAAILYRRWILKNNLQDVICITNLVHDEINVEVRSDYAELAAKNLEECMSTAGNKWCKIVPLTATAVVTKYWTH